MRGALLALVLLSGLTDAAPRAAPSCEHNLTFYSPWSGGDAWLVNYTGPFSNDRPPHVQVGSSQVKNVRRPLRDANSVAARRAHWLSHNPPPTPRCSTPRASSGASQTAAPPPPLPSSTTCPAATTLRCPTTPCATSPSFSRAAPPRPTWQSTAPRPASRSYHYSIIFIAIAPHLPPRAPQSTPARWASRCPPGRCRTRSRTPTLPAPR